MKKKETQKLYEKVCKILWDDWDPIGVNDTSIANDEYDGYAARICRYILEGADEHALISHLRKLRISSLGLEPDDEHDCLIAKKLISLIN